MRTAEERIQGALDSLDWGWITLASHAVKCAGAKREYAESVLRSAESSPPFTHCEYGMFRAIKFTDGHIEIFCIVSDVAMPSATQEELK